jgi:hypothetical protein
MEVTVEEARAHLGMATQRQWNERAMACTTPALLSLYSIVTLTAQRLSEQGATCVQSTAGMAKPTPPLRTRWPWCGDTSGIIFIVPWKRDT